MPIITFFHQSIPLSASLSIIVQVILLSSG